MILIGSYTDSMQTGVHQDTFNESVKKSKRVFRKHKKKRNSPHPRKQTHNNKNVFGRHQAISKPADYFKTLK